MTREARIRSAGILFYTVLLVTLLLTDKGWQFIINIFTNMSEKADWAGTLIAVVVFGAMIFTSDAMGWVFSAITQLLLSLGGGVPPGYFYAMEWRNLTYNLKDKTIEEYEKQRALQHSDKDAGLDERWKGYSDDVFLSYFWQQGPQALVEWVSRRHTRFWVGASSAVGMALALLLSIVLTGTLHLGTTVVWWLAVIILAVVLVIFWLTSASARTEAWQMTDIWLRAAFDPHMGKTLNSM